MSKSPFQTFSYWLFDGDINSDIPDVENLLKYNSPINHLYMISIFQKVGQLNLFLDKYLNNIGLYYIDKKELAIFLKSCIQKFNVSRRQLTYVGWPKRRTKLYEKLTTKFPMLKKYDISLLCDVVDQDPLRDKIYTSFSLDTPKKNKTKNSKVSLQSFFKNFTVTY